MNSFNQAAGIENTSLSESLYFLNAGTAPKDRNSNLGFFEKILSFHLLVCSKYLAA